MAHYTPDNWKIIRAKIGKDDSEHLRILGTWNGGYVSSSHWKISSGIVTLDVGSEEILSKQSSGSVYHLMIGHERLSGYGNSIFQYYRDNIEEGDIFEIVDLEEVQSKYLHLLGK